VFKSANEDNKDFKTILKSLGIFNRPTRYPAFSTEDMKNATLNKFPRFVKNKEDTPVKTPMHTDNTFLGEEHKSVFQDETQNVLKESVNKFVRGFIDSKAFEKVLSENKINPKIEEINKHIRNSQVGTGPINYKELMIGVMKYKNE
jgi:hypothetical protein